MALNRVKVSKAAEKLVRQGRLEDGIAEYKRILEGNPNDVTTLNKIGDLYRRMGQSGRALSFFLKIAEHYRDHGFAQKAVAMYKKIVKIDPSNVDVLEQLASLYTDQGLIREAQANLREAARLSGETGEQDKALELESRALELRPGDNAAQRSLALRLAAAGEIERAVEAFQRAASGLAADGKLEDAVECCREALAVAPLEPGPATVLCRLLVESGQSARAVEEMERLLGTDPGTPHLRALLGDALLGTGDVAGARQALEEVKGTALEGDPDYHMSLVRLNLAEGNSDQAVEKLDTLVNILQERGENRVARELLAEVVVSEPTATRVLELLLSQCRQAKASDVGLDEHLELLARLLPGCGMEALLGEVERMQRRGGGEEVGASDIVDEPEIHSEAERLPMEADASMGAETGSGTPDEEFIAEHLTEAEVFIKYRLLPKAAAHLRRILDRYPTVIVAHQRLVELYLETGDHEAAARQYVSLAGAHRSRDAMEDARRALLEARRLEPDNESLREIQRALANGKPLPAYRRMDGAEAMPMSPPPAGQEAPEAPAAPLADDHLPLADLPFPDEGVEATAAAVAEPTAAATPEPKAAATPQPVEAPVAEASPVPGEEIVDLTLEAPSPPPEAPPAENLAKSEDIEEPAVEPLAMGVEGGGDFFDLAHEIEKELIAEASDAALPVVDDGGSGNASDGIREAIASQVDAEDHQTHYQLGIAFKEMGMLDEAIGEFQQAARHGESILSCCSMLGLCFREKGMGPMAEKWYQRGLQAANEADTEQRLGLLYDLAELNYERGAWQEAHRWYTEVFGVDARYRDVGTRLQSVAAKIAADGGGGQ